MMGCRVKHVDAGVDDDHRGRRQVAELPHGGEEAEPHREQQQGIGPHQIDCIYAHGTSTPAGDVGETVGIRRTFGDSADKLMVSSTKSTTGHMLGAAGVVEAIFSVLAIRDQVVPPTINLENQDPVCDLDYVPNTAREMKIDVAVSNSFGFGGTNGSLVFCRFTG